MAYSEMPWRQQERPDQPDNGDINELIDDRPEDAHLEAEYEDRLTPWETDINPYDGGRVYSKSARVAMANRHAAMSRCDHAPRPGEVTVRADKCRRGNETLVVLRRLRRTPA